MTNVVSIKSIMKTIRQTESKCSWDFIHKNGVSVDGVCATTETLSKLENILDPNNPTVRKTNEDTSQHDAGGRNEIISNIRYKTNADCSGDIVCASKQVIQIDRDIHNAIKENTRPSRPIHHKGWLSDLDIKRVMKSIKRLYDDFDFIEPSASDWDKYESQLSLYNIPEAYSNGVRKIGIIFNLDIHTGPGTHWVALFIDMSTDKPSIEYYNSFGTNPPSGIIRYINKAGGDIKKIMNKNINIMINNKKHQHENRECGMYAMNYIIRRLDNSSPEEISNDAIPDNTMKENRNVVFNV